LDVEREPLDKPFVKKQGPIQHAGGYWIAEYNYIILIEPLAGEAFG
jgi:hypothetical protein